jgi:hypothetical protein
MTMSFMGSLRGWVTFAVSGITAPQVQSVTAQIVSERGQRRQTHGSSRGPRTCTVGMMLLSDTVALFTGCAPASAGVQHIDGIHGIDINAITGVAAHSLVRPFNIFSHDLCS